MSTKKDHFFHLASKSHAVLVLVCDFSGSELGCSVVDPKASPGLFTDCVTQLTFLELLLNLTKSPSADWTSAGKA